MLIKGITRTQLFEAIETVNAKHGYRLVIGSMGEPTNPQGTRFTFNLRAQDSKSPGARRSWSGRRGNAACWHAHRDLYRYLFTQYEGVTISTMLAKYTESNFEDTYPRTAYINIGAPMIPAYMPDLCDCDDPE